MKRLGILTSGGDAPGMNAAIRAATLVARARRCEVMGIRHGYRGLLDDEIEPLAVEDVANALRDGGTLLRSARCLEFHERTARDKARRVLADRGIEGLVVIGGNGSLAGALALTDPSEAGESAPKVIGIPASIDNDVGLTSRSIGVDTALNTIVEACDKIADTASAHDRTFIVEVMGRDCGYLAMASAIAAAADAALFPEAHRTEEQIVKTVVDTVLAAQSRRGRSRKVLILKAEGVRVSTERLKQLVDEQLQSAHAAEAPNIETRITVLGHVVRGGRPSAFDRLLGSRFGNVAARCLLAGETRKMIAWVPQMGRGEEFGTRSPHDPYCWIVDLAAALAVTDEMLRGENPLVQWRTQAFDDLEDVFQL